MLIFIKVILSIIFCPIFPVFWAKGVLRTRKYRNGVPLAENMAKMSLINLAWVILFVLSLFFVPATLFSIETIVISFVIGWIISYVYIRSITNNIMKNARYTNRIDI